MKNRFLLTGITVFCLLFLPTQSFAQDSTRVYFATGLKIGVVTDSSAVILTRLSRSPEAVPVSHKQGPTHFGAPLDFDENMPIPEMDGAVPGSFGQVQISLISEDTTIHGDWHYVSVYQDFIVKQLFTALTSNTVYKVRVSGRKNPEAPLTIIEGKFQTAPSAEEIVPILFTSSTCQYFWSFDDAERCFKLYDSMRKLVPAFHCQTGDYVYYDKTGPMVRDIHSARHKWHAMNSRPSLREFYSHTASYMQKDDHDLLRDDATPFTPPLGELSYEDGLRIWREQVPIMDKPYHTVRWGKDLQIWIVEGREYRTAPNRSPDDEKKSIWGAEQIEWFKRTLEASDASFKILVSPTPIVGPDRAKGKFDNHSNASFGYEGQWLRQYLADQQVIVINGDRHWQYASHDSDTGLWEFSQGPVSNKLAAGWKAGDLKPEHTFLRVKGGFLATNIYRDAGKPYAEFIHYDVEGNEVNKEVFSIGEDSTLEKK